MFKEFEKATRELDTENKDLRAELDKQRTLVNELEAILDQGQLDFDEMDANLERYRAENLELDQRLHDALKVQIRLQSEREQVDGKIERFGEETSHLKERLERELKFSETWTKERESLELLVEEYKKGKERSEMQINNLRDESNTRLDLLERKDMKIEKLDNTIKNLTRDIEKMKEDAQLKTAEYENTESQQKGNQNLSDSMNLRESCVDCGHSNDGLEGTSCIHSRPSTPPNDLTPESAQRQNRSAEYQQELQRKEMELEECASIMQQIESQKELVEDHKNALMSQIQSLEQDLDDERMNHEKDVEDCLREIADLRDHIAQQENGADKTAFDNRKLEYDLKEALERIDYLEDKLDGVQDENDRERSNMIEAIAALEEQVNDMEDGEGDQLQHMKNVVQQLEELRQQEEQDFQKTLEASQKLIQNKDDEIAELIQTKDAEIADLREDVIQLKTSLDEHESKNMELTESMTSLQNNEKLSKARLLDNLRHREESLAMLQERSSVEDEHNQSLRMEVEKLNKAIEKLRDQNENNMKTHHHEKEQMQGRIEELLKSEYRAEFLQSENENLKADIEYFLNDRQDQQDRYQEMTRLRSEITNLRYRLRKLEEENAALKKELMEAKKQQQQSSNTPRELPPSENQLFAENRKLKLEIEKLELKTKENTKENHQLKLQLNSRGSANLEKHDSFQSNDENRALKEDIDMLESQLAHQTTTLEELLKENGSLKEQLEQSKGAGTRREDVLLNENQRLFNELEEAKKKTSSNNTTGYDTQILNSLTRENNILKQDVKALEMLRAENQRLKTDLGKQQALGESNSGEQDQQLDNLRKENKDLQVRIERVKDLTNENRMLKQELRDIENKHIATNERIQTENKSLKKQVDDLFKKNQDLELSNISPVPTNNINRSDSLSFKQKAASFDNLAQASWKSSPLSKSSSIERLPQTNRIQQQNRQTTLSHSDSLERFSSVNKQHSFTESASFDQQSKREHPLNQSNSFERFAQRPLSQSGSFERLPPANQYSQRPISQSGSLEQLIPTNQQRPSDILRRSPRPFITNDDDEQQNQPQYNFPPDAPYVKQIRVRFSGGHDDLANQQQKDSNPLKQRTHDEIRTSPQIKTILNPIQPSQQKQQLQQQQRYNNFDNEVHDQTTYTPTPRPGFATSSITDFPPTTTNHQRHQPQPPPQSARQANWGANQQQTKFEGRQNEPQSQGLIQPSKPTASSSAAKGLLKERPDVSQMFSLISFDESPAGIPGNKSTNQNNLLDVPMTTTTTTIGEDGSESSGGGLKRTPSIKDNPFFEMDRTRKQSKSVNNLPTMQSSQDQPTLPKEILKFDMRPKSTPPSRQEQTRLDSRQQQQQGRLDDRRVASLVSFNDESGSEIGNDFVKRLKGVFEKGPKGK